MGRNTTFGSILSCILAEAGDSQKAAAEKLNVSPAYINRVIKGIDNASVDFIKQIYKTYHISEKLLDDLFIYAVKSSKKKITISINPVSKYSKLLAVVLKLMTFETKEYVVLDLGFEKLLQEVKTYASKQEKN